MSRASVLLERLAPRRFAVVGAAAPARRQLTARSMQWSQRAWQREILGMWDRIGFVTDVHLGFASLCSRVPWYPSVRIGNDDPVEVDRWVEDATPEQQARAPGITPQVASACHDLLNRVSSRDGGQDAFKRELTLNLALPGECTIYVRDDPETGEEWFDVYSIEEVRVAGMDSDGQPIYQRVAPGAQSGEELDALMLWRVWDPDPRYTEWALSAMKAAVGPMREWLIISDMERSRARSRLANVGILLYDKARLGTDRRQGAQTTGGGAAYSRTAASDPQPTDSPVFTKWAEAQQASIENPDSTDALVPINVGITPKGDSGLDDVIKHIRLDLDPDEHNAQRLVALAREIAYSLPLPLGAIIDANAANHWTGWLLEDQAAKQYVGPKVTLETEAVAESWIRPGIRAQFPDLPRESLRALGLWYDLGPIVVRPNRVNDVREGYRDGAVGGRVYRDAIGVSEEDAPTEEELEQMEEWRRTGRGTGAPAGGPPNGGEPAASIRGDGSGLALAPISEGVTASIGRVDLATRRQADALAARLGRIDASLGSRLLVASNASVESAVRVVSGRLRRAAGTNGRARDLAGVANGDIGRVLGSHFAEEADVPVDELIEAEIVASLQPRYREWVAAAQHDTMRAIARAGTEVDRERYEARYAEGSEAGWALLAPALLAASRHALFGAAEDLAPAGEADASSLIGAAPVRRALARAGGTETIVTDAGGVGFTLPQLTPPGGVATSGIARDMISIWAGLSAEGWYWIYGMYGTPATEFPPHADLADELDGEVLYGEDPRTINPGEWPYGSFFEPGDHEWCRCGAILALVE